MAMELVLCMTGGIGETSYANNSLIPRKVIMKVKTILEENLEPTMSNITFDGCCRVADLGCGSGPNSLLAISNILNIIAKSPLSLNHELPNFQIYLNDMFENDFNSIFKLLPDFYQRIQQDNFDACFINATLGSFYGRLYPNNYIHLFHSSYGIHWLSQIPKDTTKTEPLNKKSIGITRTSSPLVHDAYLKQFERDFKTFLQSRFEEIALGGVMILTFVGCETTCNPSPTSELFSMLLNEMVQEVAKEQRRHATRLDHLETNQANMLEAFRDLKESIFVQTSALQEALAAQTRALQEALNARNPEGLLPAMYKMQCEIKEAIEGSSTIAEEEQLDE